MMDSGHAAGSRRTAGIVALALDEEELSPRIAALFEELEAKNGFIPNILKAHAVNCARLEAYLDYFQLYVLAPSGLSPLEKEMIAVVVSSINRCFYCLTAHGAAVRQLSPDPEMADALVMNYRAARLDGRTRGMLDFAARLTESPWAVGEAERASLRDAGFSDRDIWDIVAVTGHFNMSNRMATALDVRPNAEYRTEGR